MDEFELQSQVHLQELYQAHEKQLDALKQSVTEILESKPKKWCKSIQYIHPAIFLFSISHSLSHHFTCSTRFDSVQRKAVING